MSAPGVRGGDQQMAGAVEVSAVDGAQPTLVGGEDVRGQSSRHRDRVRYNEARDQERDDVHGSEAPEIEMESLSA